MKRIGFVGGGGFVGARCVEMSILKHPALADIEVVPLIRQPRGLGRLSRFGIRNVNHRLVDAAKPETMATAFAGLDAVVNLTMGDNARIVPDVQNMYDGCVASKVPLFIHLSSSAVYSRCDTPNLNDDSPWDRSHWMKYAREKGKAEDWLRSRPAGPTVTVTLRPGLIWGPRSPWVVGPATSILGGGAFLVDGGKAACNLCHVDNLIHMILAVARAPRPAAGFYNVGDADRPNWHDYYVALAAEMGFRDPVFHQVKEGDYKRSLRAMVVSIKESAMAQDVYKSLSPKMKESVKSWIMWTVWKRRPPIENAVSGPDLTKGMWWLQTTRYQLPIAKFQKTFAPRDQLSFKEAMRQTGVWMRFCGFVKER